ncbi:GlsB/YeaQ/YmgE family stress response membrane protein [Gordonia sp. LSe1-13]|uniref:GlsB/YeaQ/YmgE family stress response membrane protein n=2 Tax=Gordonia TaxID=2053 RepID=A0ABU7MLR7_9ACTN|nr:GlsB/YeaQ/YmgE family stress response membrane protein [Gordonia sp. LSe1-13]MEE4024670.1 GlsB/YeaQ/YmgE family stress response membrane protein [Gordonia sp. PKS22-38]
MLIIGIILFGMLIGAGAQLVLGKGAKGIDWTLAIVAGLVGSFVGGLLISLLSGDGLEFRASGIIGSIVGAILITAGWMFYKGRSAAN